MIPTRYGQYTPCGVFIGLMYVNKEARAVYIPTDKFSSYSEVPARDLHTYLQNACTPTSAYNGKRNTAEINIETYNRVANTEINGCKDWYVPSINEVLLIQPLFQYDILEFKGFRNDFNSNNHPGASKFVKSHDLEATVHVHSSTISITARHAVVKQYHTMNELIYHYYATLEARLIPMRHDVIARKES